MKSVQKVEALSAKRRITGQGMTEYIIVVALIAIACIGAVGAFGDVIGNQFANMSAKMTGGSGQVITAGTHTSKTLGTYDD